MKRILLTFTIFLSLLVAAMASPTKIVVRVKAKDAKFIGTGIGGAFVIIRNTVTGEVLAKGLTQGASGSTELIMQTALKRGQSITDSNTAKFEAVIDIDDPLLIDVEVTAPVSRRNAAIKGSAQLWVIPGKNIEGEGLVIELPGFVLDIIKPTTHQQIKLSDIKNNKLDFTASLTMLCGCTITKGGVWNSDNIEVSAIVKKDGIKIGETALAITSEPNIFSGVLDVKTKGVYQLTVYAYDKYTNNTGVDIINFVVQ